MSHRYLVIQHKPEPTAVWYDSDQRPSAVWFARSVARQECRTVYVWTVEMGVCGCGPASVTDGEVTVWADQWGECMSEGGPDCGCGCHELEAMFATTMEGVSP